MKIRSKIASTLVLLIAVSFTFAPGLPPALAKAPSSAAQASAQKMRRADFRISGASCVSCLRRVGKKMREQAGVLKADVSIFKPYWAIVIYEPGKIDMGKIYQAVKDEKVRFEDIEDKPISELPLIVIPKGLAKEPDAVKSGQH